MLKRVSGLYLAVLLVAVAIVVAAVETALAVDSGNTITRVRAVYSNATTGNAGPTWATVVSPPSGTRASTQINVTGSSALLVMRFTAQSQCAGTASPLAICKVRIMVTEPNGNTVEANPAGVANAFDTPTTAGPRNTRTLDRSFLATGSGTYTVQVQFQKASSAGSFMLSNWSLIVERAG
jgi:hypothetical protein